MDPAKISFFKYIELLIQEHEKHKAETASNGEKRDRESDTKEEDATKKQAT